MPDSERLLILGIGNLLMGDEGVGVHAVRALEAEPLPAGVDVLDGGTGGLHLLSWLSQYSRVVIIDATLDDQPPGTVRVIQPRFLSDYPRCLAAHDIGLRDLLEAAAISGPLPAVHLITVSIADLREMEIELSPPVQRALPRIVEAVRGIMRKDRLSGEPRSG